MQLTNESITQLFTLEEDDWTAINKRVGATGYVENILQSPTFSLEKTILTTVVHLAGFPLADLADLQSVCNQWKSTTFSGLLDYATALVSYADESTTQFTNLHDALTAQPTTLPNDVMLLQVQHTVANLQQTSSRLAAEFDSLEQQIANFSTINSRFDQQAAQYQSQFAKLGVWLPIMEVNSRLENAIGRLQGVWSAITSDLEAVAQESFDNTNTVLAHLEIDTALSQWASIKVEASAFASQAQGQTNYWMNWR